MVTRFITKGKGSLRKVIPLKDKRAVKTVINYKEPLDIPEESVSYGAVKVWIDSGSRVHGFGRAWTLKAYDHKTKKKYSFRLGQDTEVMRRLMDVDVKKYPADVSEHVRSYDWSKVMPIVVEDYMIAIFKERPTEASVRKMLYTLQPFENVVEWMSRFLKKR